MSVLSLDEVVKRINHAFPGFPGDNLYQLLKKVVTPVVTNITASTATLTSDNHNDLITLNRAAGIAVTLPAATGSGIKFEFVVGTTITSNTTTIKVVGNDIMVGRAILLQDGGDTLVAFETAADSDTITLDGSTTGGIAGMQITLTDIAADTWLVSILGSETGLQATPFSATVTP